MNFHSHRTLVFAFSLLAAQSTLANTEWIGVECTYTPSDESKITQKTNEIDTDKVETDTSYDEKTKTIEKTDNLSEIKHKFFINEANKIIKDANRNDLPASFDKSSIHVSFNNPNIYKIVISRNGYSSSTLYVETNGNGASHYTGICSTISLENDDLYPNQAYPSTNRGF